MRTLNKGKQAMIKANSNRMHKAAILSFCVGLSSTFAGCSYDHGENSHAEEVMVDYFSDNGLSNAVAPIQHPAGEHHNGVTYIAYQGTLEDPYVVAYNHHTETWTGPYQAGTSDMGKDPSRKIDNHGKPALIVDDKGYIHIVFGGHGGMEEHGPNPLGNIHYGTMKHVVSKKPLDISTWEQLDNIPPFGTYNQFVKMDNGDIYLFYRHGAHRSDWVYQKSTDNGRTFAAPVSVLKSQRRTDVKGVDSWYAWFTKGEDGKILAAYNYHMCWDNTDERKHDGERRHGYFMEMDTKDGTWTTVAGEVLTLPITKAESDRKTQVFNSGELWSNRGTARFDQNGNPHVSFYVGEHMGRKHGGPQEALHFRWDGSDWRGDLVTDLPVGRGDMTVHSDREISMVLAHRDADNIGKVSWWNSEDGGESFTQGQILLERENTNFAITSLVRNAHPDAQIIVAGRVPDTDLRKMYLLGEQGPVQRAKQESTVAQN